MQAAAEALTSHTYGISVVCLFKLVHHVSLVSLPFYVLHPKESINHALCSYSSYPCILQETMPHRSSIVWRTGQQVSGCSAGITYTVYFPLYLPSLSTSCSPGHASKWKFVVLSGSVFIQRETDSNCLFVQCDLSNVILRQ